MAKIKQGPPLSAGIGFALDEFSTAQSTESITLGPPIGQLGGGGEPVHGSLIWSGPTYSPATGFHLLRVSSDGRLTVGRDSTGSICTVDTSSNEAFLTVPEDGMWLVESCQTFSTSSTIHRGCGLVASSSSSESARRSWADINIGRVCVSQKVQYLPAGQRLWPWVYIGGSGSNMSGSTSGTISEYSITKL